MGYIPKFEIAIVTFILLISPLTSFFTLTNASDTRKWTFLVYLDADNNLEAAGIKDFNEMETVGSSAEVTIIVQMDRIAGYDSSNNDWTETRRYRVTHDNDTSTISSELLSNMDELNMGDSATLSSFASWAIQTYPAQYYALILWNHGGSSTDGPSACWDDTNSEDCLSLMEIKEALADVFNATGEKIDVLGFDACLMGMAEVAYQLRDYVGYMIGSEETEPNDGYPYDMILAELSATVSMPPAQLASTIVTKYFESYTDTLPNPEDAQHATSAAFNLTETSNTAVAVSDFAESILGDFSDSQPAVKEAWEQSETFSGDYVDLYHFAQLLKDKVSNSTIKIKADAVLDAVNRLIISEGHGNIHPNAHGVSIYYPRQYNKTFYVALDFASDTLWDEFLDVATNVNVEITPVCPTYTSDVNIAFMDIAIGDVDGDFEYEIVAVGNYSDYYGDVYFIIAVFEVTPTGLVQLCNLTWSSGDFEVLFSVICADVDNDLIEEIVTCGGYYDFLEDAWFSYIGVFTIEYGEIVVQAYDEDVNISVESLDVADVDGDEFPEIVISGRFWDEYYVYAYVAVGNNSAVDYLDLECSYAWYIGYDADLNAVAVGDTDADGLAEIVVGGVYYDYYYGTWIAYLAVLNCSGNMLYLQTYASAAGLWINSVDVADVDGNGFNEIVVSGYCWDYYYLYMFIEIESNYIDSQVIYALGTYYWVVEGDSYICSINVADIEGDGIEEIIAVGYYWDYDSYAWTSYEAIFSWSPTIGLATENENEGDSQTYTYSVANGNVDDDAQTEIVTCSEEKGGVLRAKIKVAEASNHVVTTGTISGIVTDGEKPIQNAVIEVYVPRLSFVTSATTSSDGSYVISNLPEGCYAVMAHFEGKISVTQNGILVKAGQTIHWNFALTKNIVATTSHIINVNGQQFSVVTVSNSTISNFSFNATVKTITFSVSAATGTTGFCSLIIPETLLGGPYIVKIGGVIVYPTITSNGTHTFIDLNYSHSIHTIEIKGSTVVPEFNTNLLMLHLAFLISFLAVLSKKTRKTKNQN